MFVVMGAVGAAPPVAGAAAKGAVRVSLPIWGDTYDWPAGHGASGWQSLLEPSDPGAYSFAQDLGGVPGLSLWLSGDREYRPGGAEWRFRAPGTTRIASAELELSYANNLFAHHCLEAGLRATGTRDATRSCSPPAAPATQERYDVRLADPSSEPLAKEAYVRVDMPVCKNPAPNPCSKWIPSLDPLKGGHLARVHRVDMVLVDDDLPAAGASGPLRDLAEDYTDGQTSYDVTLSGTDAGAGVSRMALDRVGTGERLAGNAACDPAHRTAPLGASICPPSTSLTATYDTHELPEGEASFRPWARDLAGNEASGSAWRFFVDRTPPPAPYDFDIFVDPDTDDATISWLGDEDPALTDGHAGSGLQGWQYRFYHPRSGWSDWSIGTQSLQVPDSYEGDDIVVEARAVDNVGNASAIVSETLTIPPFDDEEEWDLADGTPTATAASASPRASSDGTMTLTFAASTMRERREQVIAAVDAACSFSRARRDCTAAVKHACTVGGACKPAKAVACRNVYLFCTEAEAASFDYNAVAHRLRPHLFFDTDEKFRPLNVDTFLREEDLLICDQYISISTCEDLDGHPSQFNVRRFHHRKAIMQQLDGWVGQEDRHHTDKASCLGGRVLDCDDDTDENATYWQVTMPSGPRQPYFYVNYWFFYRYNGAPFDATGFQHEGDWEGITLAVNRANTRTFHYAAFDQHGHLFRYLRDALRCNGDHTARCSSTSARVNAYVADGTHATYPRRCSATIFKCRQTDEDGERALFEGGHDGSRTWGLNSAYDGLMPLPRPDDSSWVDWPGSWNEDPEHPIRSPAYRDPENGPNWRRYSAPWAKQRCTTRDSDRRCPRARAAAVSAGEQPVEADCDSWVGDGIAGALCDPRVLERALRDGTLERPDDLTVRVAGRDAVGARGLTQLVGEPLAPGTPVQIAGRAGADAELQLRVASTAGSAVVRVGDLGLEHGGRAVAMALRGDGGAVAVRVRRPDGTTVTRTSAATPFTRAPARRVPRVLHAAGGRRSVRVVFVPATRKTVVELARSCRGAASVRRTVRGRAGLRRTLTLRRHGAAGPVRVRVRVAGVHRTAACRRVG